MKKIILFLSVFLLGCQTQTPTPKLDIKIERPRPVTLKNVAFNIIRVQDKSYIALDSLGVLIHDSSDESLNVHAVTLHHHAVADGHVEYL